MFKPLDIGVVQWSLKEIMNDSFPTLPTAISNLLQNIFISRMTEAS